jgi:hypothetical protein
MAEKKVRVKIRPLRGIGGYGEAGDIVEMPKSEAERYQDEGYVDILSEKDASKPQEAEA